MTTDRISRSAVALLLVTVLAATAAGCTKEEPSAVIEPDPPEPPIEEPVDTPAMPEITLEDAAIEFVGHLAGGEPDEAWESFDATMAELMPPDVLGETWDAVIAQSGQFEAVTGTRTAEQSGYDIVFVTCRFADTSLDVQLAFDSQEQVAGLFFLPVAPAQTYLPPAYATPDAFTETEVVVGEEPWQLPATLTVPEGDGPFPAVILVHGSGPSDRDETVGSNKPFKDIAWGLASNGIAVLRYEKRTSLYPAEMAAMMDTLTVREETLDDAVAAIDLLTGLANIDAGRIFILGHSLGGMLAPRLAERDSRLAGLIILAGPTRGLEDLVLEQTNYIVSLDGETSEAEAAQLTEIERQVALVRELDIAPGEAVLGAALAYWQDLADYNPVATVRDLDLPILVLQGERDYQVTMEDFAAWRDALAANENATLRSYPGLNHLFVSGIEASTPSEYAVPGNVAAVVITDIAAWIDSLN